MILLIFSTVAIMVVYMALGFILCKSNKAVVTHAKSMSALLIYILGPAMIINSFLGLEYSHENVVKLLEYFIITLVMQILFFCILYMIFHRKYDNPQYRIMSVGGVLGNVGFLGMPVIASIYPNDPIVLCYSSINVMSMNLIVFTIGAYLITNDKKHISIRSAILNPTTLAIIASIPLFIFDINFPDSIGNAIALLAKMVTPVCMIILGMRLSEANLIEIFSRKMVYASCFLKLIALPIFAYLFVKIVPFGDAVLKTTVVVLAMMPAGAIIESLAELHESEQGLAANVVLLTTILSVITIPLMVFILV